MGFEPVSTPRAELAVWCRFDGEILDAKVNALLAQSSQSGPIVDAVGEGFLREGLAEEGYVDG
jgi:hypothetical protein